MTITFALNGTDVEVSATPTTLLLDAIRDLGLTGTKEGCGVGVCGACTVLVDDDPVSACLYLCAFVEGKEVWTVEGLALRFPTVIDAIVDEEGVQCGICTSGQVVAICSLVLDGVPAEETAIRNALTGNLCRCTGYRTIVAAAIAALK